MSARTARARTAKESETTPEGLTALLYHITHAASQKLIDPEFARKLGREIEAEYEALRTRRGSELRDCSGVEDAMARFQSAILAEEGRLLTRALTRLRGSADSVAAPPAAAPPP
ncbi:hypothetical protein BKK79_32180 [Cupriavidus sp. USMAA2-4]|uniref:hypothetical protein n=1 Tax=Cupriavidus sp. USMAA2-4 TaxID=876364 RepID=UPI0008A67057|nr:hypothetical protein [Cupriavidus sp. USMAA2-4]AOY97286.1 hypothetical protein BKK79_32180 [Cupriavidus sp. USMAA2-4]